MKLISNHTERLAHNRTTAAAALAAVALCGAVFAPLLRAYFRGDDFLHLFQLANYDLLTNLVIPHGGHVYAVRNFVYFLCWHAFGMNPTGYFTLAVLTHMLNVALLFGVIHRLTGRNLLAAFGAAVWGTCPLQAGVLEWYSVYGHALAATVELVLLYQMAGLIRDGVTPSRGRLWVWFAIALAGTTCFGVGLAVAMVLPWVIVLLFPGRYRWWWPPLLALVVIVPALYMLLLHAYEVVWKTDMEIVTLGPQLVALSGFGLPRALWELASYGTARMLCGAWCIGDTSAVTIPIAAAVGVVILAALTAVAALDRRTRRLLLACGLLALAVYGIISTARGFFFLERPELLSMAIRYHYAALIPVTIALCVGLDSVAARLPVHPAVGPALGAVWAVATIVAFVIAPAWLRLGAQERADVQKFVADMHAAAAATPANDPVYVRNRVFRPMLINTPAFPKLAALFTLCFPGDSVDGRRVYFLEPNPDMRAWNAYGVPINRLLIDPRYVPPGAPIH